MDIQNNKIDVMKVAPHLHEVIFENEKVRVLKLHIKPGEKAQMHSHPENISYILTPGKLKFTNLDNMVKEVNIAAGQVTSSGPVTHTVENIGDSEVQTVQIELKEV